MSAMDSQKEANHKFPLSHRLVHSHEFDAVFDNSAARISSSSLLFLAKENNQGFNRLGMIVSKKIVPGSVKRNKFKRRIREAFRRISPLGNRGWDIVVLTRPGINAETELSGLLMQSFESLGEKLTSLGKI